MGAFNYSSGSGTVIYALTNIASATTTATTGVDISGYEGEAVLAITYRDNAGTTPTLAITVQESSDNASADAYATCAACETFTAVGAADSTQFLRINTNQAEKYIKLSIETGGTPDYDICATLIGRKKEA